MIVFFSAEAGGAQILTPVIRFLQRLGQHRFVVLARGRGAARFALNGIDHTFLDHFELDDHRALKQFQAKLVITSACSFPWEDMGEKYFWAQCKSLGIPCIGFLDDWQNYSVRFSGESPSEYLSYRPTWLSVINEDVKKELIELGLPAKTLKPWGHPALEDDVNHVNTVDKKSVCQRLNLPTESPLQLYVSQPANREWTYTQARVFEHVLSQLNEGDTMLVKLHPKDDGQALKKIATEKFKSLNLYFFRDELSAAEAIAISDRVWGISSIMLTVAYLLQKPVISIQLPWQPGFNVLLSKKGYIQTITDLDQPIDAHQDAPRPLLAYRFNYTRFLTFLNSTLEAHHA